MFFKLGFRSLSFLEVRQDEFLLSDVAFIELECDGSLLDLVIDQDVSTLIHASLQSSRRPEESFKLVIEFDSFLFFGTETLFFEIRQLEVADRGVVELDPLVFDAG